MWVFNLWNRPNVRVQATRIDRILEAITVVVLVCLWGIAVYFWNVLPEQIPVHFDLEGNINGYGDKSTIFVTAVAGTLVILLLGIAAYNPKMINIPVKINSPRQYVLMCRMSRVVNVTIAFLFVSILLNMAAPSLGIHSRLIAYSDALLVCLILLQVIYYTCSIYRARRL